MKNKVQLITYADRLGCGDLAGIRLLLTGEFGSIFGGVHLLPFFDPIDGSDAGFDPVDHTRVDSRLGGWEDVRLISETHDVCADLIVNHISSDSYQFQDYLRHESESAYNGMFLRVDSEEGLGFRQEDLRKIYRPRPTSPTTKFTLASGSAATLWTTFTNKQVDLDVGSPVTISYLRGILETLASNGVKLVRLDAVGYAVKSPGTSCFMTPETYEFMAELSRWSHDLGMQVLAETHTHYERQIITAQHVDWVYDFALPPLLLHTLFTSNSSALKRWFDICPRNAVTVLDTHDGIGVMDVGPDAQRPDSEGLLCPEHIDAMVEKIHVNSNGASKRASADGVRNLDLYQVNCTYFSALACDDQDYLLARLVQFFAPGIPQVYYVGLLVGENDVDLFEQRQNGRDINRAYFSERDVLQALAKPVVQQLVSLIRFRNEHPAFDGEFSNEACNDSELRIDRVNGDHWASLHLDFKNRSFCVECSGHEKPIKAFSEF